MSLTDSQLNSALVWGEEALYLTNKYRREANLSDLEWSQELFELAMEHSINMAEGVVPFSHNGFNDRFRRVPFATKSWFSENVAYNYDS